MIQAAAKPFIHLMVELNKILDGANLTDVTKEEQHYVLGTMKTGHMGINGTNNGTCFLHIQCSVNV